MNAVIGALRAVLGLDSAAFDKGLDEARSRLANFGPALKKGLGVASAAAAAAGAAIGVAIKGAIDEADKLDEVAQKIGLPTEELSRLKYAAEINGVAFETLQGSVGKLSRNMADAAKGVGAGAKAFEALGITVTNADGSLKSSSAVMREIADRFAAMPDGAQKTAMAMQLMGKSGADMILMLNGGSEALAKTMAEADKFGQVFTAEMGANAGQFNENIDKIVGSFGALAAKLATAVLPALVQISDMLLGVTGWFGTLSPAVQSFIGIAAGLTAGLAALAVPLGLVATAIAAIGGPITLTVAGIAALSAAVIAFWPEIKMAWEWLTKLVNVFVQLHVQVIGAVIQKLSEMKAAFVDYAGQLVEDFVAAFVDLHVRMFEIGGQIIEGLWNGIKAKWESVKGGIANIGTSISDSVKNALGIHSPSRVMHDVGLDVMQGLHNGMASMRGTVLGAATSTATGIKGAFADMKNVGADFGQGIENAFSGIGASIAEAIKGTKSWRDVALDALRSVANSLFSSAGFGGGGFGGLLSGVFQGLLGFANGGSFMVGGSGGIDSQLVAFRASPNERVSITKPGQELASGGGPMDVRVYVDQDGNWQAAVERLADRRISRGAPAIVNAARQQAVPAMAEYQANTAGAEWR